MSEMKKVRVFNKCPYCGSKKTVAAEARKAVTGESNPDDRLSTQFLPLADPRIARLTIPALVIFRDACWDCGAARITRVDGGNVPVTAQMPKQEGDPPFLKG